MENFDNKLLIFFQKVSKAGHSFNKQYLWLLKFCLETLDIHIHIHYQNQ